MQPKILTFPKAQLTVHQWLYHRPTKEHVNYFTHYWLKP